MLYWLYQVGTEAVPAFRVFGYLTVRTALAFMLSLGVGVLLGPLFIRWLKGRKIGQKIRGEGIPELYERHKTKADTPTMGGILILFAFLLAVVLCGNPGNQLVWLVAAAALLYGAIGAWDDWSKLVANSHEGLSAKGKLLAQLAVAFGLALVAYWWPAEAWYRSSIQSAVVPADHALATPFAKLLIPLGGYYIPWIMLVLVGTSNAVNLTDGLDGLAIGCVLFVASAYAALAYLTGRIDFTTGYLWITYVRGAGELAVVCAALAGASLAFLWFNCHPAEVFMGDTGSLALGGTLAMIAVLIHQELLLLIVGGVFVVEALSVMLQVSSFKLTGKRIFRMTPIHHHFEQLGWHESKIIIRFWIVAALLAVFGLASLKLR